jgi:F-type H+-transporting ATPase subunit gamma
MVAAPSFKHAATLAEDLMAGFLKGEYDEVFLAHNVFNSPLSQTPTFQKLLPIEAREFTQRPAVDKPLEYLAEPPLPELVDALVPKVVKFKLYYALLENAAGEHGARMTAMDNATSNCEKMIDHYTLMRNRARQAAITTELIEIISGAEAL